MTKRKKHKRIRHGGPWEKLAAMAEPTCPRCGMRGRHFVPPSLGDEGFYICATVVDMERQAR